MNEVDSAARPAPTPAQLPPEASEEQKKRAYEVYVAEMARRADGTLFLNHDQANAEIVLAQLFKSARRDVKILTGCLWDDVYGSDRVSKAASRFAIDCPDACLQVLHEAPICANRFVNAVSGLMGSRFSLTEVGPCKIGHFVVVDGKHFRVETDQDHHKAFVAFGDEKLGGILTTIFDEIAVDADVAA